MLDGKDEVTKSIRFLPPFPSFPCRFRRAGARAALAVLLLAGAAPGFASSASADPTLTVEGGGVNEGDTGTRDLSFTVRLAPASERRVTVDINTGPYPADVTAISDYSRPGGPDYEAVTDRTLTFEPGETEKTVDVRVYGDRLYEYHSERFKLHLSNPVNAEIEIGSASGWIIDDDGLEASLSDTAAAILNDAQALEIWRAAHSAVDAHIWKPRTRGGGEYPRLR